MSRVIQIGVPFALVLFFLNPCDVCAQVAAGQLLVQPIGGMVIPLDRLKEVAGTGPTAGLSLGYMLTDHISMGGDINITRFRTVSRKLRDSFGQLSDYSFTRQFVNFDVATKLYLLRRQLANLFVEAGGDASWALFKDLVTRWGYTPWKDRPSVDKVVFGYHVGGGFDSELTRAARVMMNASYYCLDNPDGSGSLRFWTLRLGVAFQFRPM